MQFQFNGVLYSITNNELIIAAVILVVLVLVAIGAYLERRKVKTQDLRNRVRPRRSYPRLRAQGRKQAG